MISFRFPYSCMILRHSSTSFWKSFTSSFDKAKSKRNQQTLLECHFEWDTLSQRSKNTLPPNLYSQAVVNCLLPADTYPFDHGYASENVCSRYCFLANNSGTAANWMSRSIRLHAPIYASCRDPRIPCLWGTECAQTAAYDRACSMLQHPRCDTAVSWLSRGYITPPAIRPIVFFLLGSHRTIV